MDEQGNSEPRHAPSDNTANATHRCGSHCVVPEGMYKAAEQALIDYMKDREVWPVEITRQSLAVALEAALRWKMNAKASEEVSYQRQPQDRIALRGPGEVVLERDGCIVAVVKALEWAQPFLIYPLR